MLLLVLADHLKQIKTIFFNVNVDSVTSFVPCSKGPSCAIRVNTVVEISELYNELAKGGLISESFSYWLQSPKKCAKHYPDHLLFRWIELKIVFWEIGANLKNILRIHHLYLRNFLIELK